MEGPQMPEGVEHWAGRIDTTVGLPCKDLRCRKALSTAGSTRVDPRRRGMQGPQMPEGVEHSTPRIDHDPGTVCKDLRCRKALSTPRTSAYTTPTRDART